MDEVHRSKVFDRVLRADLILRSFFLPFHILLSSSPHTPRVPLLRLPYIFLRRSSLVTPTDLSDFSFEAPLYFSLKDGRHFYHLPTMEARSFHTPSDSLN